MRTAWIIVLTLTLLSPLALVAINRTHPVFWTLTLLGFLLVLSLMAHFLGHDLIKFWTIPVAAMLPWMATLLLVVGWVPFLPKISQQGGAMSGMIPMFGLIAAIGVSIVAAFLTGKGVALKPRLLWAFAVSGIPAFIIAVFLSVIFIKAGRS